ncbi:MAG: sigma-70 family RNA polymerase sigma factor [Deltaproteobacteria bacterium]|nr:sigma-70 family RNA polymerase sigma factor [Deltaproteobacteria bacterium]MBW2360655.1 sigma-70 family RNA polymerase sigma factor [Deltaproteobacteria bacterium]
MSDSSSAKETRWRALMTSAQQGDCVAYEKLLAEILPPVRGFVRNRVFDTGAQEDVVQNVFLSVHRARHTYRSERPFTPWLYAVARNAVTDYTRVRMRRRARETSLDFDVAVDPATLPSPPHEERLSPELSRALEQLPDTQRDAVVMIQLEGLSVAEAAQRAGVSAGALKVRAHRGYRALRASLGTGFDDA